jgi:hypothetical protein
MNTKRLQIILERFMACPHVDQDGNYCVRCRWHEGMHVSDHRIWSRSGGGVRPIKIFSKDSLYGIK